MSQIRRRILTALAIAVSTIALAGLCQHVPTALADSETTPAGELLRLHVIANSDTFEDQALKLKVRDAVLDAAGKLLMDVASKDEAIALVRSNLHLFESVAEDAVRREGFGYEVAVSIGRFGFPDRIYGNLFVPAGEYDAVRVVIGAGQGTNWWCVLFPPLCFIDMGTVQPNGEKAPTGEQARALPVFSEEEAANGDNLRKRLEKYVQSYIVSLDQGIQSDGAEPQSSDTGQMGIIARLEDELDKIKLQFGSQKYAIQPWMWFF